MDRRGIEMAQNPQEEKPRAEQPDNSPEKYRLVLVVGGMVLGVAIAYLFSFFSRGPVKLLDVVFWAIGGAVIGFFASVRDPRK
jgi:hypothetical protein